MTKCSLNALLPCLAIAAIGALAGSPAYAQYRPQPALGAASAAQKGENYHVEIGVNLWNPDPNIGVSSDGLGVAGTLIDAQGTLGVQKKQVYDIRVVLKPAARHKFRFSYLPMSYTSTATLNATVTFNGRSYPINAQVASDLQWNTYRLGYEYDFVSNKAGFFGIVLEAKVTQAQIQLNSIVGNEFSKAQAPIPAIGAIARVYLAPGISITGEYTYFKLPTSVVKDITGHYTEYDVYSTINVTNNLGAQAGIRKIDVGVSVTNVTGSAAFSGPYFGGVVRF
ncbi:MAG: hypothetical protein WCP29_14235 [Acidobacteriota bacterium]